MKVQNAVVMIFYIMHRFRHVADSVVQLEAFLAGSLDAASAALVLEPSKKLLEELVCSTPHLLHAVCSLVYPQLAVLSNLLQA